MPSASGAVLLSMFKGKSGEEIKNTFIKPKVMAWTQEVSANYPVTDIFGDKRTEINSQLDVYLREKFASYGIIIDTVNFTDISVDNETAAAIQKKVTAQQLSGCGVGNDLALFHQDNAVHVAVQHIFQTVFNDQNGFILLPVDTVDQIDGEHTHAGVQRRQRLPKR